MNKAVVIILAIFSMIFWGISFVWTAYALQYLSPTSLIFFRLVISTFFLFIFSWVMNKLTTIRKGDLKKFFLLALFTPFLYFIGENYGVKYTSPTLSAVMIATIPLFVALIAWYRLGEKISRINTIGILISFAGVLIMIFQGGRFTGLSSIGIAFLILAVASAVIYTIYLKQLSKQYNVFFLITVQNLIGTIYFLPIFLFFDAGEVSISTFSWQLTGTILGLAIFCSTLAFIFFTISVRELGVAKTDVFTNLIPVITLFFSYFFLQEIISFQQLAGIGLVIGGLFLSQRKKSINPVKID